MEAELKQEDQSRGEKKASHLLLRDPEDTERWEEISPRKISAEYGERFEGYVVEIFEAFGIANGEGGLQ